MTLPRTFFLLLAVTFLVSCESQNPEAKEKAAHHSTATVQLYPSPLFPRSDRFIANQSALLTSDPLIKSASKNCDLDPETLSSSLVIEQIPNTDLLTITVYHDDENQPKVIVQALLDTYRDHRKKIESTTTTAKLKTLDKEIATLKNLVEQRRKDIPIRASGIPHLDKNSKNPLGATEEQMFQTVRQKLADFKTQRDQITLSRGNLDDLSTENLVTYAAGLDLPENQVTHYYTQHREALETRRTLIAKGLAANHPDVIAIEEKAEGAMQYAKQEAVSLKEVLKTKLELINRQIERMSEMVKDREKNSADLNARDQKYNLAKEAYEDARKALQNSQTNQQTERSKLSSPARPLIIHGWEHE